MNHLTRALIVIALLAGPAAGGELGVARSATVEPSVPRPVHMSIVGLSLTAVAVIGARVSNRNSDTMMFMVLASLAVTALMVIFADRQQHLADAPRPAATANPLPATG